MKGEEFYISLHVFVIYVCLVIVKFVRNIPEPESDQRMISSNIPSGHYSN